MPARLRQLLLLGLPLLAACGFEASYAGSRFKCPDGKCPSGQRCIADLCQPASTSDAGPDAMAGSDATVLPVDATVAIDAPLGVCERAALAQRQDDCSSTATPLADATSAAGATVYGTTIGYANDIQPGVIVNCGGRFEQGPDAIYSVTASAGQHITATLTPVGWDAALYVIASCVMAPPDCLGGSDATGNGIETKQVAATATGTYYVAVDSFSATSSGCYTLNVKVGP